MKDILILHRYLATIKQNLKNFNIGITYNELLILIAINGGTRTLISISKHLCKDKSSVHKDITSLKNKELITPMGDSKKNIDYSMTNLGEKLFQSVFFKLFKTIDNLNNFMEAKRNILK